MPIICGIFYIMKDIVLSVVIPSYKDPLLNKTVDSLLKNSRLGEEMEIVVVLDGYTPPEPMLDDSRVSVFKIEKNKGMRNAINAGVAVSKGKYIMKTDEHCMFGEGFDVKLLADIEDDWVVIPRRYKLDVDKWIICEDDKEPIDYEKLIINRTDKIGGMPWTSRTVERKHILMDEDLVFQGSCWVMSRKHFDWLGGLSEVGYGTFAQEPIEIALKTWLGGGKVMVNKKTWYAHKHRKFGRIAKPDSAEVEAGNIYSRDFWLNNKWDKRIHDLDWLMKRFNLS